MASLCDSNPTLVAMDSTTSIVSILSITPTPSPQTIYVQANPIKQTLSAISHPTSPMEYDDYSNIHLIHLSSFHLKYLKSTTLLDENQTQPLIHEPTMKPTETLPLYDDKTKTIKAHTNPMLPNYPITMFKHLFSQPNHSIHPSLKPTLINSPIIP